jgi:hypothetical protein
MDARGTRRQTMEQRRTGENVNPDPHENSKSAGEAPTGCECSSVMAAFCGPAMADMARECPCKSVFRRHRAAVYSAVAAAGLVVLVLSAGWIAGIIAFFRTI